VLSSEPLLLRPELPNGVPTIAPPDNGLGGRLVVLTPRGGCGKALMLIVFRIVLFGPFSPEGVLCFGSVALPPGVVGGGSCEVEGALRPLRGKPEAGEGESDSGVIGMPPILFLDFDIGKAGKAVVGGPYDGLEGRGIAAAIVGSMKEIEQCNCRQRNLLKSTIVLKVL